MENYKRIVTFETFLEQIFHGWIRSGDYHNG